MGGEFFVEREEGLPLRGQSIVLGDEGSGGVNPGILHGGKDLIGRQGLQGFLRPGAHKGVVGTLAISGDGVGGIIPGSNHDGQGSMQVLIHPGASGRDMLSPGVNAGQTLLLAPGGITGKLMPAESVGQRASQLQEALKIGAIIVIGRWSYELGVGGESFELRDHLIPGLGIGIGAHAHGIFFIAIFVVDRLLREDVSDRRHRQGIVGLGMWVPGRMQAEQGNGSNLRNSLSLLSNLLGGRMLWQGEAHNLHVEVL